MGTIATPTAPAAKALEKTYSYFSADTFESVDEKVTVNFVPPADLADAMSRIGNDQGIVLNALTAYLQRAALSAAKHEVMSKGVSKKIVLSVLKPFRMLPPWSNIEKRTEQTEELLKMLRANEPIIAAIKAANAVVGAADDDDDEGEE